MPTELAPQLPLSEDDLQAWQRRIDRSKDLVKRRIEAWRECVQAYLGKRLVDTPERDTVVVNKEFPFVEMKKSQLLFQVPELNLEPQLPGLEQQTLLFQAALNHELSADRANVKVALDEGVWDTLVMGIGPTKIGYVPYLDEQTVDKPVLDPMGQPVVDPLTGAPQTSKQKVIRLLKEEFFWRRVNPKDFLLPDEWAGSDFDDASWLGFKFRKPLAQAIREYKLPKDFDHCAPDLKEDLGGEKESTGDKDATKREVEGYEVWYYAARFDPDEPHPDKIRVLTLIDGYEKPVRHTDSPYQRLNEQGQLIGMKGFPLHPLTLRAVADRAYPPSDVEISIAVSEELSKGRTQMVRQRETSIPMRAVNKNMVDPDTVEKLKAGTWQGIILTDGPIGDSIQEIARANYPRENFTFQDIADREYEELWALGKNQRGLTEDATRTATEIQAAQSAADVRLDAERARVLTWFTTGARKFGALLQLFKDDESYVEVLGPEGAKQLQAWNKDVIQGEFLFKAKPDSALRIDAAARRKQMLDLYNLTGNDPNVARVELLKTLFRSYNVDPSRIVVEQLPEKGPEPPKLSLAFKGEDALNEAAMRLAQANGLQVPPELLQMAQMAGQIRGMAAQGEQEMGQGMPHGGAAQAQEPLSKHALRGDGTSVGARTPQGA